MSDVVPTLEDLMDRLEKAGMEKQASELREVLSQIDWSPFATRRWERRPTEYHADPAPSDPSQKGFQEGERYTDLATGTTKRYQMGDPIRVDRLRSYFDRGMFVTDFLEDEWKKETDPRKKSVLKGLLDKAIAQEKSHGSSHTSKNAFSEQKRRHWLSDPINLPPREDPVIAFLKGALETSSGEQRTTIEGLIEKYEKQRSIGTATIRKCASALRQKGYDALANRLEEKIATGVYGPHVGVRIRSMKEYVAESKAKGGEEKSMFDEMLDKYVRVLEKAAAIVKKTKVQMHDPKGLEDVMKPLLAGDHLMMQELLEIGEPIKETWS